MKFKEQKLMKIGIVLSVFFVISTLCSVYLWSQEKNNRRELEGKLSATLRIHQKMEAEFKEVVQIKNKLQGDLEAKIEETTQLQKHIETKEMELAKKSNEITLVSRRLQNNEILVQGLETDLEQEKRARELLQAELEAIRSELKSILEERAALKERLVKALSKRKKLVNLEKIVVESAPSVEGRILVVNKEHGFIVIDLGAKNNLELGTLLSVYQDESFIAKARVDRIYPNVAAATILPQWRGVNISKENCLVKILKKIFNEGG
jgi:predicted RNase H-like nuclease (RuvC/YqgF family)